MRAAFARPTIRAAAGLVIAAVVVLLVWRIFFAKWIDAWMPNIVIGLLAIAATITFVETIVRRDERERVKGRVEWVMRTLREEFGFFCEIAAMDYVTRRKIAKFDGPEDVLKLLGEWLIDQDNPTLLPPSMVNGIPLLLHCGLELDQELQRHRVLDREDLHPDLIPAIEEYSLRLVGARLQLGPPGGGPEGELSAASKAAEGAVIKAAFLFGTALARVDERGTIRLNPFVAELASGTEEAPASKPKRL